MIIAPKFTEEDIDNLRTLIDAGVKAIGFKAVQGASHLAQVLQDAMDDAQASRNRDAQQSLFN